MDHAVARVDIGGGELGAVDADGTVLEGDGDGFVGECFRAAFFKGGGKRDARGDDVKFEDRDELGFVLGLKERLKRALGQFGESGVGGGEDGERSRAFERADEIGGGEGGGERLKRAGGDGGVDDIGFGGGGRGGDGDDWCESPKED